MRCGHQTGFVAALGLDSLPRRGAAMQQAALAHGLSGRYFRRQRDTASAG